MNIAIQKVNENEISPVKFKLSNISDRHNQIDEEKESSSDRMRNSGNDPMSLQTDSEYDLSSCTESRVDPLPAPKQTNQPIAKSKTNVKEI